MAGRRITTQALLKEYSRHTNDNWFWALALAAYAADQIQPMSGPIAKTI